MPERASPLTVSVVICAYTERRWPKIAEAIDSLRSQRRRPDEIVLVVDHNGSLLARAAEAFPDVQVVPNVEERGLSGSRNTGVYESCGDVVVFLDDDAVADVDWLRSLIEPFDDPLVLGTGGFSSPVWEGPRPRWFPSEFLWTVGASWTGLPEQRARVRNPMGGTMAFRREAFLRVGGFSHGVGRIGRVPAGCEETEWAIRVQQAMPDRYVVYVPEARIFHHTPADRATWGYFLSRCWSEGRSKAVVTDVVGRRDGLASERSYVRRVLPRGVVAGMRDALHGDSYGLARSAAILLGLLATTAGYVHASFSMRAGGRASRASTA